MRGVAVGVALIATALALTAPAVQAADTLTLPRQPESLTAAPPGFALNGRRAIEAARHTSDVAAESSAGRLTPRALLVGADYWLVRWYRGVDRRAEVELNGRTGVVVYALHGRELDWPTSARGTHGPYARTVRLLLAISGLLFVLPFVDPRRPLRLRHLDLFAVVSLGASFAFDEAGNPYVGTPLMYPPLLYLTARLGLLALRAARGDPGRLTWMSPRVLGGALVALLAVRYGLDIAYGRVSDIGYDTLLGADSIIHGYPVYDPSSHLGSYGPMAYVAYVPFTLLFPFTDLSHLHTDAAKVAAIAWDAGTVAALYALGRRLRTGPAGTQLGLALAFAFAACPWTGLVLSQNTNDGLVAFGLTVVLLLVSSPAGRGLALGLVAAVKFAPLALAPLFARARNERGLRPVLIYGCALAAAFAVPIVAYLPDAGLRGFWDATIGFELARKAPFSIWGLHPELEPARVVFTLAVAALVVAAFLVPRERSVARLAAAGAALLVLVQLGSIYWYFFYVVWLIPYALVALFAVQPVRPGAPAPPP